MHLVFAEGAVQYLSKKGFDPVFGARPVKRAIQRDLETPLAKALLRGDFQVCGWVIGGWVLSPCTVQHLSKKVFVLDFGARPVRGI